MKRYSQNLLRLFCLLACCAMAGNVHAQVPPVFFWGQNDGGPSSDMTHDVATDNQGNSYIIGEYNGTIDIGTFTLTSAGSQDAYVAKRDRGGTVLWAISIGGTGFDGGDVFDEKLAIDIDGVGDVYIGVQFSSNTCTVGPNTTNPLTVNMNGFAFSNFVLAKLNGLNGTPIWAQGHGPDDDEARIGDLDVNQAGTRLVVGGWFNFPWTYNPAGTLTITPTMWFAGLYRDYAFIMNFDATNGNAIWGRAAGDDDGNADSQAYGVAIHDATGDCYLTGFLDGFNCRVDNQPASPVATTNGGDDVFTAKWNAAGGGLWVRLGGSTGSFNEQGWDVAVEQVTGDAYVVGEVDGNANFGLLTYNTQNGSADGFIIRYSAAGGELWLGNVSSATFGTDENYAVAIDAAGNAYVATDAGDEMPITANRGQANQLDFDYNTFTTNIGFVVGAVSKFTPAGAPEWIRGVTGNDLVSGYGVSVSDNGCYLHFVGESEPDPTIFYPGNVNATHNGSDDGFIGYLSEGAFGGQVVALNAPDTLVCLNSEPRVLNVNTDGNIVQWETSTDCSFGAPTVYAVTDTFFDVPPITTDSICIRSVVQKGVCPSVTSDVFKIITRELPPVTATASSNQLCGPELVVLNGTAPPPSTPVNSTTFFWNYPPNNTTPGTSVFGSSIFDIPSPIAPATCVTYTVTARYAYPTSATDEIVCEDTAQVTVCVDPLPTITATSNATGNTRCENDAANMVTATGADTYTWNPLFGLSNFSASGDMADLDPPVGITTYTVTGTTVNGCTGQTSITITELANPNQPSPIDNGGVTVPCVNDVVDYSVVPGPGLQYEWATVPTGVSNITPRTTIGEVAAVAWLQSGTHDLEVRAFRQANGVQCYGPPSTLSVTVDTLPFMGMPITGTFVTCENNTLSYNFPAISNATTYDWSVTPGSGWNFATTNGTNNMDVEWLNAGNYTLGVTPSNNCGTGTQQTVAVTVNPAVPQPVLATNTTPVCQGDNGTTYAVQNTAGYTYTWTVPTGATLVAGQGTNAITVDWSSTIPPAMYTIDVEPTSALGCAGPSLPIDVEVSEPAPGLPSAISGNPAVCQNTTGTYSVVAVPDVTYTWAVLPAGPAITPNGNSADIDWGTATPGNYLVTVAPSTDCGTGPSQTFSVNLSAIPQPPSAIVGDAQPCLTGGPQNYIVLPDPAATSYTWTNTCGWPGASTTNQITYTPQPGGPCDITVVANSSCGSSAPATITVDPLDIPMQPAAINGPTPVCQGATEVYTTATNEPGVDYIWTGVPSGATILSGQGTNTLEVNWGTAATGNYTLTLTPTNKCGNGMTRTITVEVITTPAQPSVVSGSATVCNNSASSYSVMMTPDVDYTWTISPTGPILVQSGNNALITWNNPGTYTLTVTPSNICGNGTPRTLVIDVTDAPNVSAGADTKVCGPNAVVIGTPAGGTWACEFCPGSSTITGSGNVGVVSGMQPGPHVFRYTVNDAACGTIESFVLVENESPIPGQVISDATVCEGSTGTLTLTGYTPNSTIVRWESSTDNFNSSGTPINNTVPTYTYNNVTQTTQYRAVLRIGTVCNEVRSDFATVTVVPEEMADPSPNLQTVCTENATIQGNMPTSGTGTWTFITGPAGATVNNSTNGLGVVTGMTLPGDYVFRWTIDNPPCATNFDDVVIRRVEDETIANAGPNRQVCGSEVTLLGNQPTVGTGEWTFINGPAPAFITTAGREGIAINMDAPGDYTFRWTITNPACGSSNFSDVIVTRLEEPSQAIAGLNTEVCTNTATVMGNMPAVGTGTWSFVSGPGTPTISTTGSIGTIINMDNPGDYVFRWTISNGGVCPDSQADVTVTKLDNVTQAFVTNMNRTACGTNQISLTAVQPTSGTGQWSFISGPSNAVVFTQGIIGLVDGMVNPGDYVFRWTVDNACGNDFIDVTVTKEDDIFFPAFAGQDQFVCDQATAVGVGSTPPPGGRGIWKFVSGPHVATVSTFGVFGSFNNMQVPGEYVFEWEVEGPSGNCPTSSSRVRITREEPNSIAAAGPAQSICGTATTLVGNTPTSGQGVWTYVGGGPVNPNVNFTGSVANVSGMTQPGTYTFRWEISNMSCPPSFDDVTVEVLNAVNAGILSGPNSACSGANSGLLTLSGYEGDIVRWEVSNDDFNTFSIINNTSDTYSYFNLTQTTSYRVIVDGGDCGTVTSNSLKVEVFGNGVAANAGSNRQTCTNASVLVGNDPGATCTGTWNFISGPMMASVTQTGNVAIVNDMLTPGDYIFQYEIDCPGGCGVSTDNVIVTKFAPSEGGTVAGTPEVCAGTNTATFNLTGQVGDVVRWEYSETNWATKVNINTTSTTIALNNLTETTSVRAIVRSGICGEVQSTDFTTDVLDNTMAMAGPNQAICGTSATLTGNDPGTGVGTWNYVAGPAGAAVVVNQSGTRAFANGMTVPGVYTFRWTIDNGTCGISTADVTVTVTDQTVAGQVDMDMTVCAGTNTGTLNLTAQQGDVLRWEYSDDNWVSVFTITNTTTSFTFNNLNQTRAYRAVVKAGSCEAKTSLRAVVSVVDPAPAANAGADQTVCSDMVMLSGNNPNNGMGNWTLVSGAPTANFVSNGMEAQVTGLTPGMYEFQYEITNAPCPATTDNMMVTVLDNVVAGTATGATTVCPESNMFMLTLTGHTGNVVRWEWSRDGFITTTPIASSNAPTLNFSNLTETTAFRAVVEVPGCGQAASVPVIVTVEQAPETAFAGLDQDICTDNVTLAGNNPNGGTPDWRLISSPAGSTPTLAESGSIVTVSNMDVLGRYELEYSIQNGTCQPSRDTVAIDVIAITNPGSLNASTTNVCAGINTVTVNLAGATGTVVRWETSTDNFSQQITQFNTSSTSLNLTNLTQTTSVVAVLQNGVCPEVATAPITINVDQQPTGGAVAGGTTVCTGSNSGNLTLTGHQGTIVNWQTAISTNAWVDVIPANNSPTQSFLNLTQSTQYRAIIDGGACGTTNSAPATVVVSNVTNGGVIAGGGTICAGANSGLLNLTGATGNVIRWERADDAGFSQNFMTLNNTGFTQGYSNLNTTTYFRAFVQSGSCTPAYSAPAIVTVNPASDGGVLAGGTAVCGSGPVSGTLTLSGFTGNIVRWESSSDNFATTMTINNTSASQTYNNPTTTMCYRAVVQSAGCAEAFSNVQCVDVTASSVGGTLNGAATVCGGTNSGTITLTGQTGNVVRWESATNSAFTSATPIANTSTSLSYNNLSQDTWYRAVVQSGNCPEAFSAPVMITTTGGSVPGTISGATSSCGGVASGTLTLNGFVGNIERWESSTTSNFAQGTVTNLGSNASINYSVSQTTYYRAVVRNGTCPDAVSGVVTVEVGLPSQGGLVSGSTAVCGGSNSGTLTLSGNSGNVVRWESSANPNFQPKTDLAVTSTTLTYNNLTQTTYYRAVVQNGGCPEAFSATAQITVSAPITLNAGAIVGCDGTASVVALASGGVGGGFNYTLNPGGFANTTGQFASVAPGSYTVTASDGSGCSATANVVVGTTPTPTQILSINNVTTSSALVQWASVPPGTGVTYDFRYRIAGSTNWTNINGLTSTFFFLNGLQNNTSYEVEVRYTCPGSSTPSGWAPGNFTTLTSGGGDCSSLPVPAPGGVFVNNVSATNAIVNWNPVAGAQGYIVSYGLQSTNPGSWPQFVVCHPQTTFNMNSLTPGSNYSVRVRTNCSNCTTALNSNDIRSNYSPTVLFATTSFRDAAQLDVPSGASQLNVYPNPNNGSFTVSFVAETASVATIKLLDVTGREVFDKTIDATIGKNTLPVEVNGDASGVYLLQFEQNGVQKTVKVILN